MNPKFETFLLGAFVGTLMGISVVGMIIDPHPEGTNETLAPIMQPIGNGSVFFGSEATMTYPTMPMVVEHNQIHRPMIPSPHMIGPVMIG